MNLDIVKASNLAIRLGILLILVFALIFVLTYSNVLKCKTIPFWCDAYYAIKGNPDVLIVYGEDGLGDPNELADLLRDPDIAGIHARQLRLQSVNPGNLDKYEIVIVTHARTMGSDKIKMFLNYSAKGGNLVWTGDAGVESNDPNDFLSEAESGLDLNSGKLINPWARKNDSDIVRLNKALGVDYIANYCDVRKCAQETPYYIGMLMMVERDNPLVYGFSNLQLHITDKRDFALVETNSEGTSTTVMTLDFGSNLVSDETNYGNHLPMIISNADTSIVGAKVGENIYYYAMPPEYYMNDRVPIERRYGLILSKLYYGLIYG